MGNEGIFLNMGNAGFISSAVSLWYELLSLVWVQLQHPVLGRIPKP